MRTRRGFILTALFLSLLMPVQDGLCQAPAPAPPAIPPTPAPTATPASPPPPAVSPTPSPAVEYTDMVVLDLNGDGLRDVVVADATGTLFKLINDGTGGYSRPQAFTMALNKTPGPVDLVEIDLESDGDTDLLVVAADGSIFKLVNKGNAEFEAPQRIAEPLAAPRREVVVEVADLNTDADDDVVFLLSDGNVYVLLSDGRGSHLPLTKLSVPGLPIPRPIGMQTADINGDGNRDIVVAGADGSVHCLVNNGQGSFTAR